MKLPEESNKQLIVMNNDNENNKQKPNRLKFEFLWKMLTRIRFEENKWIKSTAHNSSNSNSNWTVF